jgi:hypothetical protein
MSNQARQLSVPLTMNQADPDAMSKKILVLGAGELGMPVLRSLAQRAKDVDGVNISVLLRASPPRPMCQTSSVMWPKSETLGSTSSSAIL